jgi:hypothetical protein
LTWGDRSPDSVWPYFVDNPEEWTCLALKSVPPGDLDHDPAGDFAGIRVMPVGKRLPLLEFVARRGFPERTVPELRRIFADLKVPYKKGCKPNTKAELLASLCKFCIPECSDGELKEAVLMHDADDRDSVPSSDKLFENDSLSLVMEMVQGEDMAEEVARCREKYHARKVAKAKAQMAFEKAEVKMGFKPAEKTDAHLVIQLPFVPGRGFTQVEAKRFLPPNAYVRKDCKRDPRWQIRADYIRPAVSCQFERDNPVQDNDALVACLRRAWIDRECQFEDKCPWDFDIPLG